MANAYAKDKELAARCLAGESRAWDDLARIYAPLIDQAVRNTLRRCGYPPNAALAQELAQDVLASLSSRMDGPLTRFRGDCSLAAYLIGVTVRHCVPRLRDRQVEWEERQMLPLMADVLAPDAPPSSVLQCSETSEKIRQGLEQLSEPERLALHLFYWDGLAAEKIGRVLGISKEAAWQTLSRARDRLRPWLKSLLSILF